MVGVARVVALWGLGFWTADKVANKAGEGLGDGARNALTIAALGAVAYVLWKKA